ncbi:MAG: hypothetical protein JW983_09890 [Elusimicrobia bacterium]|nr:hypothetical protein [Elusimicrobiota bacterium]
MKKCFWKYDKSSFTGPDTNKICVKCTGYNRKCPFYVQSQKRNGVVAVKPENEIQHQILINDRE